MLDWIKKLIKQEQRGLELKNPASIKPTYQMMSDLQKSAPEPSNETKTVRPIESRVLSLELRFEELERLLIEKTPSGQTRLNRRGRMLAKW